MMVQSFPGLRSEPPLEHESVRLRKEVEVLKQELQSAQALIRVAPAFFGFVSLEGKLLDLNELALQIIEARRDEVVGRVIWECPWWQSLPEPARRMREAVAAGARGCASQFDIEYRAIEGGVAQLRWVAITVTPLADQAHQITQIAVSGIDITERRLAAQEIERSRSDLHDFFMQAPLPMVIMEGPEYRFTIVNPLYEKFIGRKALGRTFLEIFTRDEAKTYLPILDKVYRTGEPFVGKEVPLDLPAENGVIQSHWINFGYHPFRDSQGRIKGIFAIVQDVTEQRTTAESLSAERDKLESTVEDLEKERELRDRFVAALTHDLRTPLTAAKMSAQLLLRRAADPAHLQKIAGRIVDNMDRADLMIRDLLDASRIKAGERIALNLEECDLVEIARAAIEDMASVHGDRFVLAAPDAIPATCDRTAVRRMIENLAGNAVKYGAATSPITISLRRNESEAEISVHNEGNPIPLQAQGMLFEAYRRLDSAGSQLQKGWGIGLTLVRGFARAHGGSVSVQSSESTGTRFSIHLPQTAPSNCA